MLTFVRLSVLLILLEHSDCARILGVFSTPSISHQIVYRPLIQELIRRGHEVVVITTDPAYPNGFTPDNLTEIGVYNVSYGFKTRKISDNNRNKIELLDQLKHIQNRLVVIHNEQLEEPAVKELIESDKKFDLLIIEPFVRSTLGFSHVFKAPVVLVSSFSVFPFEYNMLGAPIHPLLYPFFMQKKLYNLTYFDEMKTILTHLEWEIFMHNLEDVQYDLMRKHFGNDVPSFEDLYKNVELLLLNLHNIWADNQPVTSNIKYMGGILTKPGNPLPEALYSHNESLPELKTYLDSSKNGVIYVSFGTNVLPSSLSSEKINMMMSVLSRMPYTVLFRWDSLNFPRNYANIMFSDWFPQRDLLTHPKMKLFITQGGLQSTDEAIDAAVPLLGLAIFADQFYNVAKYIHHGIGLQLDFNSFTEEEFEKSVNDIINNARFKTNMLKLRSMKQQHPVKPIDLAVWWMEHIIKYGGSHLKSPSSGLSWTEYYEIDLIIILLTSIACVLLLLKIIMNRIIRKITLRIIVKNKSL